MENAWQKAVAEAIGTLALVFIGAGAVVLAGQSGSGLVGIALAHGIVLAVMISVLGHISGGHFNPAVTVGVWVTGNIKTALAGVYIVAQLAGAVIGALLLRLAVPETLWRPAFLGSPTVGHTLGITNGRAVILEAILTFFLVFVVYGTAIDERGPFSKIAGLPIGFVLIFDILAGGPLTGAAMNPARALGPMLVGGHWTDWWVYWIGPVGGGIIAASIYWFAFLGGREKVVSAPKTEQPIGGGPGEEERST